MNKTAQETVVSLVSVHTYTNGRADMLITGDNGTLTLAVHANGPTIVIRDPDRGPMKCKAVWGIEANGHFKGWLVAKKGANGEPDTLAWFPERKERKRAKRRNKALAKAA
jgi:hypothetical protein